MADVWAGYVELVYSSSVALSYESGAIAKFVAQGLLLVQFKIGDAVWESLKTRMGWADYNNAGPVQNIPANVWTTLTNNTLGPQTQTSFLPEGVTSIVVTNDLTGPKVYVNGVLQVMTTIINTLTGVVPGTGEIRLGRAAGQLSAAEFLDGYINEWSFWAKALSEAEVLAVYNAGTPTDLLNQDALIAWLRMGDGDRYPILQDKTGNGHIGTMTNMTALNIVNGMVPTS